MAQTKTSRPKRHRVEIREIGVDYFRENAEGLFREHWEEVAKHKQVMLLQPHWVRYYALEEQDLLLCLGVFSGEELIGYSVNFLSDHLHYRDLKYAQNDLLFVAKKWRRGSVGVRLILETERQALERGCKMVLWHAKQATTFAALLGRMGYGIQDIIYSKVL